MGALSEHVVAYDIPSEIAALDLKRLIWKLCHADDAKLDPNLAGFVELEYRRFLSLRFFHPEVDLVPNKLVDELWHLHILDTKAYHEDCYRLFGKYLHHVPYFGMDGQKDDNLKRAFEKTKILYETYFGPYPFHDGLEQAMCVCQAGACNMGK